MADRYWVGGTGNWSDTARWSTSSGGSSGASVPTSADNVFFNDSSAAGTFTVTIDTALAVCGAFDASGITNAARKMTLTGTASVGLLSVNGSWTNPTSTYFAWTTWTGNTVTFAATGTLTTNAVSFVPAIIVNGASATVTLGGALTASSTITLTNGTFDTSGSNYSVSATGITISANSNTRALNLNASTATLSGTTPYTDSSTGGYTINAGTSTITCSNANPTFAGAGKTFYNISFSSTSSGFPVINGSNTFNNFSVTSRNATGTKNVNFGADQTINGTLTLGAANTAIRRIQVVSSTLGTQRTLTVATFAATTDIDFRDIQAAGASVSGANWNSAGTGRFSNGGGNGNKITFDTPKTVYWNLTAGGNWSATAWAATTGSGAAVNVNNFPLAQDTAVFQADTATLGDGNTITPDASWFFGAIDFSARTTPSYDVVFATTTLSPMYMAGDLKLGTGSTVTGTSGTFNFYGSSGSIQTITSNGITINKGITLAISSLRLADNLTMTGTFTLTSGTLDLTNNGAGNYTLSTGLFVSNNSNTRAITFGTGAITLTSSGTVWNTSTTANFSYTGTPTVNVSNNSATATTVTTGAMTEAQALNFNYTVGTYTLTDTSAVYRNLDFTGFGGTVPNSARTIYGDLTIVSGPTYTAGANATTFAATSGAQTIVSGGVTFDFPVTVNAPGATIQLSTDNLTVGSTRTFTLTAGTFSLNSLTATMGTFSTTGSTTRVLGFGTNGTLSLSGTSPFTASGSGLTTSGTGTITLTSGSAKAFAGGGFSYVATLNQGGAGALTVSGSNTFYDITATTLPSTITFTAGTTQTVTQFTASGTAGNLLTLNSSSPGTPFILSDASGTNTVNYVSITDSIATGGATWSSLLTNGNVDGGNNSGWAFYPPVTYSYSSDIKLRSMAQRGRF